MIPFSPPRIDQKTIDAVSEVLTSGWITTGPKTRLLEQKLAEYVGCKQVLCFNSWTNAAELALRWFGIGPGDEVILPAYTYSASANIIVHTGAKVVMVDVKPDSFEIDPSEIAKAISPQTKAIIPVDIGGWPCDFDAIFEVIKSAQIRPANEIQETLGRPLFLADAAHSFGGVYKGQQVGMQADISGYSFHAVKNLTTAEGGALAFNLGEKFDEEQFVPWFKRMALHGQTKDALSKTNSGSWQYDILEPGYKCNMTDLQAAIGLVELERYNDTLERRRQICEAYNDAFSQKDWAITPSFRNGGSVSSYHLYMLRIKDASEAQRNAVMEKIMEMGVSVNVHFMPLPLLTAYKNLGFSIDDFPNAYNSYSNEISLPVYYNLTDSQVETVINSVIKAVEEIIP